MKRLVCIASALLLSGTYASAHTVVEKGTFTFPHPLTGIDIVVFYARSAQYDPADPPILVLHGMKRNPWDYRDAWIDLAEENSWFVFVPYFSETDFPDTTGYNLGNLFQSEDNLIRKPRAEWSYRIPDIVFDHLRHTGQTQANGYLAFGHSAGSQFLHRKIAFVPDERMLMAIAANAGWYTLPNMKISWPYGFGGTGLDEGSFLPYLAARLVILLGDEDTDPADSSLRRTPEAMQQGRHRLERGHYFFRQAEALSKTLGTEFNWSILEVPGVDHDNARMAPAAARVMEEFIEANRQETE